LASHTPHGAALYDAKTARVSLLAMLAARCLEYGPPESVVVDELPDPIAGPDDVVVRVEAAAFGAEAGMVGAAILARERPPGIPAVAFPSATPAT